MQGTFSANLDFTIRSSKEGTSYPYAMTTQMIIEKARPTWTRGSPHRQIHPNTRQKLLELLPIPTQTWTTLLWRACALRPFGDTLFLKGIPPYQIPSLGMRPSRCVDQTCNICCTMLVRYLFTEDDNAFVKLDASKGTFPYAKVPLEYG